jgi:hypothetical protein
MVRIVSHVTMGNNNEVRCSRLRGYEIDRKISGRSPFDCKSSTFFVLDTEKLICREVWLFRNQRKRRLMYQLRGFVRPITRRGASGVRR